MVAVGLAEVHAAKNRRGWTALGWVAAPLAVMAFLAFQQPLLTQENPDVEVRCESTGDLELCLYPKVEGERQFITELLSPLVLPAAQGQQPYVISQGGPRTPGHDHLGEVAGNRREWGAVQVRSWASRLLLNPATECPQAALEDERDVLADVALAIPAINRLRTGGVFVVDELDSSLHPHLAEILIGFFQDPQVNITGAQILFTSHDTYLLSNLSHLELDKGQIWFTEKERDGATELFSLADFTTHSDHNIAKRYLEGRYGAIPSLAPSLVHSLLSDDVGSA